MASRPHKEFWSFFNRTKMSSSAKQRHEWQESLREREKKKRTNVKWLNGDRQNCIHQPSFTVETRPQGMTVGKVTLLGKEGTSWKLQVREIDDDNMPFQS